MSTLNPPSPSPRAPYLAWCAAHAPVWKLSPTAIGLSAPVAVAYDASVVNANAKVAAMEAAKTVYHNTVVEAATAMRELQANTGNNIRTIRAFAEVQAKPSTVYAIAQIDPPAAPTPMAPPARPTDFTAGIDINTGALVIKWKAANPGGNTSYTVRRRLNSTGAWMLIGVAGSDKTFIDTTFTAGPDSVQYMVQGVRSGISGPSGSVSINFGNPGGAGSFSVTSFDEGDAKMAA